MHRTQGPRSPPPPAAAPAPAAPPCTFIIYKHIVTHTHTHTHTHNTHAQTRLSPPLCVSVPVSPSLSVSLCSNKSLSISRVSTSRVSRKGLSSCPSPSLNCVCISVSINLPGSVPLSTPASARASADLGQTVFPSAFTPFFPHVCLSRFAVYGALSNLTWILTVPPVSLCLCLCPPSLSLSISVPCLSTNLCIHPFIPQIHPSSACLVSRPLYNLYNISAL